MVFMPAESQGKNWKLSRPFHGPYRVLQVTPTNAEVQLIDRPKDEPIFVALAGFDCAIQSRVMTAGVDIRSIVSVSLKRPLLFVIKMLM